MLSAGRKGAGVESSGKFPCQGLTPLARLEGVSKIKPHTWILTWILCNTTTQPHTESPPSCCKVNNCILLLCSAPGQDHARPPGSDARGAGHARVGAQSRHDAGLGRGASLEPGRDDTGCNAKPDRLQSAPLGPVSLQQPCIHASIHPSISREPRAASDASGPRVVPDPPADQAGSETLPGEPGSHSDASGLTRPELARERPATPAPPLTSRAAAASTPAEPPRPSLGPAHGRSPAPCSSSREKWRRGHGGRGRGFPTSQRACAWTSARPSQCLVTGSL